MTLRQDIQFLRGIAVFFVVIYHADIGLLPNGYLGVDVFFVISGFLITTIILRGLDNQQFSIGGFYLRRAKRLLPALYCTLIGSLLLAYLFMLPDELDDFYSQFLGALTFSANMVLPTQIGYFEAASAAKPLLHIWSLSLEEQYYFLLPCLLLLTPRPYRPHALGGIALLSLAWCFYWVTFPGDLAPMLWRISQASVGEWAFYLLPTRAWELLVGSLVAWLALYRCLPSFPPFLKLCALFVIIASTLFSVDLVHPRGNALLVVLATAAILLDPRPWTVPPVISKPLEKLGDWSYSVYLVHWPLFSFAYIGFIGQVPTLVNLALIPSSVLLGYLQYRHVENRFRFGFASEGRRIWFGLALSTSALFVLIFIIINTSLLLPSAEVFASSKDTAPNYGLSQKCDRWIESSIDPACASSDKPTVAIWGDSYAMHLVPGLLENHERVIQFTRSRCGPIIGLAPIVAGRSLEWSEKCITFNRKVLDLIRNNKDIKYVVMSSSFGQYFETDYKDYVNNVLLASGSLSKDKKAASIAALIETIDKVRATGKTPVLITSPPRSGFDIGLCVKKSNSKKLMFRRGCDFSRDQYEQHDREVIAALREVELKSGLDFLWLDRIFCNDRICYAEAEGTRLYRDEGHLSTQGAKVMLGSILLK